MARARPRPRPGALARGAGRAALALGLGPALACGPGQPVDASSGSSPASTEPAKPIELAPAEDRERSPYTGWTRADYEAVFARLLVGFLDHRSFYGARTRYPGGESLPAAMEGATRMLPALGAWLACPCNPERIVVDGRELDVSAIARTIVVNGTDPASPDYWGRSPGGWDQREVEAALVAEFLVQSRARVWDRLSPAEQDRVRAWLPPADEPLAANWLAFQIARNSAHALLGADMSEAALAAQLDKLEREYVGDGFYRDGHRHRYDLYNAFVIHAELSFWRATLGERDPGRAARIARRTATFLAELPYLFDARGRVVPLGRSLAYRSGVLAALHASLLAGDEVLAPGLARRLSSGNLRFHVEAGMFAADQTLTRGYHGEEPGLVEPYLQPGSQYFATRGLAVLALPPEHPFWTAREQPLPADLGDFVHAIPAIGWTLDHDADGIGLVLRNAGSSSTRASVYANYAKLDYPVATAYARGDEAARPYDAMVVSASQARFDRRRTGPNSFAVAPGLAWTRYAIAPERGKAGHTISTASFADPAWVGPASVRLTCVEASPDEPARPYTGSHAITLGPSPTREVDEAGRWAYLDSGVEPPAWGAGAVLLADLGGWTRVGEALDHPDPGTHVFGGPAGYLGLTTDMADTTDFGEGAEGVGPRCMASFERLASEPFDPERALASAPTARFIGSEGWIHAWAGTTGWIELGPAAAERTLGLGGITARGPLRALWVGPSRTRGGGLRVVAVGVRELDDERGPLLRAAKLPLTLACELGPARIRCELDGPARLRVPKGASESRTSPAGWRGHLFDANGDTDTGTRTRPLGSAADGRPDAMVELGAGVAGAGMRTVELR